MVAALRLSAAKKASTGSASQSKPSARGSKETIDEIRVRLG